MKLRNKKERLLGLCLALTTAISMLSVPAAVSADSAPAADTGWYTESSESFVLTDAADLAGLAELVNNGNDFAGRTVSLGNDIDLSGIKNWTPIGTVTIDGTTSTHKGSRAFAGTFDGQNHKISGLKCSIEAGGAGLFGYSTGTLQSFTLSGSVSGDTCTAAVAACASGAIKNITNEATVTVTGNYAGGILADAAGAIIISNCHNKGIITNGGISSERSTGRIAGIVGRVNDGIKARIEYCSNTAAITGYQYVAGIVGGSYGNSEIQYCYNTGAITGISFGKVHMGGIAGQLADGTIDSCYNQGVIHDTPWSEGHIRAVGGITGDEQGRASGTKAITNVYNAGAIELDTSKMGGKYIYMTGNISGGNNSTEANTMVYENCFYLENTLKAADDEHWSDVYKANNKAYDTEYITKCTDAELKSAAVLSALGSNFKADPDGGYPILKWQDGSAAEPEAGTYRIAYTVSGGTAAVSVASEAKQGAAVELEISDIASGMQLKSISAADAAGTAVELSSDAAGKYLFTMPGRDVSISIVLESTVAPDAGAYKLTLPENLDNIWSISADSTYYDEKAGTVKAGATVTIVVDKAQNAATTSFTGIAIAAGGASVEAAASNLLSSGSSLYHGEYTFTMPAADTKVALNVTYKNLDVLQEKSGKTSALKTYSRSDMLALAGERERIYVSGWTTETLPFIAASDSYVTLAELLKDAGVSFGSGDKLKLSAADGFSQTFTYEALYATERNYYADIMTAGKAATDKKSIEPFLSVTANVTNDPAQDPASLVCDTLNTYRLYFGQSDSELANAVKIVDSMPKCLVAVTVIKAESTSGGGGSSSGGGGGGAAGTGSSTAGGSAGDKTDTAAPADSDTVCAPYSDIDTGKWYHSAVHDALCDKLMTGTSSSAFTPNGRLTRAMLARILYNNAGQPAAAAEASFSDVKSGDWYAPAVSWAVEKGVVKGYEDGTFRPDAYVTREELAAMLYRYAGSPAAADSASLDSFTDAGSVASYARDAVKWAVSNGIITGSGNTYTLDPKGTATRAQAAAMIVRYLDTLQ